MARYVTLFAADELPEAGMRRVVAEGEALVVVRQGGQFYALSDCCTHESFRLSDGYLEPGRIHCALHGAAFDLASGAALSLPAYEDVATRRLRLNAGMVEVEIEE